MPPGPPPSDLRERFFPDSLCHDCGAPPRLLVTSRGSIFLFCPLFRRYPPQPVRSCEKFLPKSEAEGPVAGLGGADGAAKGPAEPEEEGNGERHDE